MKRKRKRSGPPPGLRAEAARLGLPTWKVDCLRAVRRHAPELEAAVEAGELSLIKAAETARVRARQRRHSP